jgi:hypothetical protein
MANSMTKFSIPRQVGLVLPWGGALMLVVSLRLETDYHDRLGRLPSLVDEHGSTASIQVAMSGLEPSLVVWFILECRLCWRGEERIEQERNETLDGESGRREP